jgi:signal transduction histidine kinase
VRAPRRPAWTATLTWKAAVFITVMCCALAALLGVLVHVSVAGQTVSDSREKALTRLTEVGELYEAGEPLPRFAGVDPPGLPASLRALAVRGERGTMVSEYAGRPTMWAAGPADGRALAVRLDYTQSAETIDALDRSILGSSVLAIGATLLVGAFAVTRVTRRLHLTAQVARRISAGDLDARVDDPRTKDPTRPQDEVATVSGALDTMASSLQRKLQSEQRFTADVAHELRTPLAALVAEASILREHLDSLPAESRRAGELLVSDVGRLRSLVDDLMEVSRFDARAEQIAVEPVDLGRIVRMTTASRLPEATIQLPDEPVVIETDPRRFDRIVANLLDNAREHAPDTPVTVSLAIDAVEREIVVAVTDRGPGVPADRLARIFERFYKADPSRHGGSSGLGLAIAAEHAALLGGYLTASNLSEGGLRMELRLPVTGSLPPGDVPAIVGVDAGGSTQPIPGA